MATHPHPRPIILHMVVCMFQSYSLSSSPSVSTSLFSMSPSAFLPSSFLLQLILFLSDVIAYSQKSKLKSGLQDGTGWLLPMEKNYIFCFLFVKRNALLGGSAEELPTPHHGIHTFFFLICSLTSTDIYRMSVMGQALFLALGIK